MTEESIQTALAIMKTRMNRLQGDTSLDETAFKPRLLAELEKLEDKGIHLTDKTSDIVFLADCATWSHQNRDKPGKMPEWMSLQRRERFLHTGGDKP